MPMEHRATLCSLPFLFNSFTLLSLPARLALFAASRCSLAFAVLPTSSRSLSFGGSCSCFRSSSTFPSLRTTSPLARLLFSSSWTFLAREISPRDCERSSQPPRFGVYVCTQGVNQVTPRTLGLFSIFLSPKFLLDFDDTPFAMASRFRWTATSAEASEIENASYLLISILFLLSVEQLPTTTWE